MSRLSWGDLRYPLILVLFLYVTPLPSLPSNVDFRGSLYVRVDDGDKVNTSSSESFPDSLVTRNYLEELFTAELHFKKIPVGRRLRLGVRMFELQASDYDIAYTSLEDARRVDDKIYAQMTGKNWELWAGDVTEIFGKGLALSLFENRDLYFNSSLRGGKASYRSKSLRLKAIYGRSRDWFDVREESVGGVNLEYHTRAGIFAGGSLVHQEGITYEKHFIPEFYGGFGIGPVDIYGEYAQRRPDDGDISVGDGTYLSIDASMLGLAAQVGYKYYNFGIENPFHTPPVAQREITTHLMSRHPHIPDLFDQVGFEINLSASPSEIIFLDLNFSRASKHDGGSLLPTLKQEDWAFWEFFGEAEIYARPDLTLKLGAGQNGEAYPTFWEEKTGLAAGAIYNLDNLWSVTVDLENMWVDDKEEAEDYTDQYASITASRASLGSLNFSYEQSSLDDEIEGDHWIGGELAAEIAQNHRLMVFYGRERGGLKCTSGVCRTVQSFEGIRLTYEGRF